MQNVMINQVMEPGRRVTVEMGTNRSLDEGLVRKIVSSSRPKEEGMYWGYKVRYAPNISSVFKNCPYQGGYDHRIGTSEHGLVINSSELSLPSFRHLLIASGGLAGLEECVEEDGNLKACISCAYTVSKTNVLIAGQKCARHIRLLSEHLSSSRQQNYSDRGSNLHIASVFSRADQSRFTVPSKLG